MGLIPFVSVPAAAVPWLPTAPANKSNQKTMRTLADNLRIAAGENSRSCSFCMVIIGVHSSGSYFVDSSIFPLPSAHRIKTATCWSNPGALELSKAIKGFS